MSQEQSEPESSAVRSLSNEVVAVLTENHRKFRSFLSKRVGNEDLAEELLQQALKRAVEHPSTSSGEVSILAWFYQILRTTLIDAYRSRAADERKKLEWLEHPVSQDLHAPAADELRTELCSCFESLLPALKPEYAELIRKIDLEGKAVEEVAQESKISSGNLYVRLHRARQALKKSLEIACGTCTEHGCLNCTCK